ncbi:hypothetical protein R5R35_001871 [Gryllus longicercus]|uniref:Ig-like domain-containing protein n=1 Tax=Gryllus longicercus TaxID=2509291 RepID=A0AAN9VLB1_9ORTH
MRAIGAAWVLALCALLAAEAAAALRDVRVVLPPVVRAGGAATLLCLFDLEGAPLYAVKWYRGTREFFRFEPANRPPAQVVPFPGVVVDLASSGERQVTLRAVPPHLSGAFSCEVSADAPSFSTAVARGELTVTDFPDLKISSDLYDGGHSLTANCTYQPLKLPTSLTFYVNNEPAPVSLVREWEGGAALRLAPGPRHVSPAGELGLRCVLLVAGEFPVSSDSVTVRLPLRPSPTPPPPPPSPPSAHEMPPHAHGRSGAKRPCFRYTVQMTWLLVIIRLISGNCFVHGGLLQHGSWWELV